MIIIVQANLKLKTSEARDKAWQMIKLMETVFVTNYIVVYQCLCSTGLRRQVGRLATQDRITVRGREYGHLRVLQRWD